VLLVWAVGGVVALAGALTYAELGAMLPDAGGPYIYIRDGFGKLPAFLYGWMLLLSIGTGALAAVALGFADYAGRFVDLAPLGGRIMVAGATIAVLTATNYFGIKPGALVQNVLTVAKIIALATLIVGGLVLWAKLGPPPAMPDAPPPRASLAGGFATAFVAVLFTIGGWQQMNMVAGEIRDPARTIPRALALGIVIVIACYLGANAVYLRALGRDGLAASSAVAADTATRLVGSAGATAITVAAMLSILGFVNVVILATPRVFFAMARDGVFFEAAARVHPRFGSPYVSILIMGLWAIVLLAITHGAIGDLLSGVVFADWIFFGLGAASVFALRRSRPDAPRPYRALGFPYTTGFSLLGGIAFLVGAIITDQRNSLISIGLLAASYPIYAATIRAARSQVGTALNSEER